MTISTNGINLIKKFEGCSLTAYKDAGGYSIGYGHYGARKGDRITQAQADSYLIQDLKWVEDAVNAASAVYGFNQNQYDALCSFTYNCGAGSLRQLTANNTRSIQTIALKLPLYNKSCGKVLSGLVERRRAELSLFLSNAVYPSAPAQTTIKDDETIVLEIIRGDWGNGKDRKDRLTAAGYDYVRLQKLVNARLKGGE